MGSHATGTEHYEYHKVNAGPKGENTYSSGIDFILKPYYSIQIRILHVS